MSATSGLSVVIPVLNEVENVVPLFEELRDTLLPLRRPWEILFIDDGSTDGTTTRLKHVALSNQNVRLIRLRRTFGQTAALQAGFHFAAYNIIVILDGDQQNDPRDIPLLLQHLDDDCDLVHGWRKDRRDAWLSRRLPSLIANQLIRRATGFRAHDLGCGLKVIRSDIARELELYGEMHRFIPVLAYHRGARCREVVVNHRSRMTGSTKYGIDRTLRVILDLATVLFLMRFLASPMKLFGRFGMLSSLVAGCSGLATIIMKTVHGIDMTGNPLLLLTILSLIAAMQFVSFGLLGELCTRMYFRGDRQHYAVREIVESPAARQGLRQAA